MGRFPIAFVDSGVGGLPYYGLFKERSGLPAAYVADRANFPYGPKSKPELVAVLVDLVRRIEDAFAPEVVVVACNTASVSALDELRGAFPEVSFVGTVPAVKPAALYSRSRRVGVLATERTVKDPYTALLAERFAPDCSLVGIAAPELVAFVEDELPDADAERRLGVAASYVERFRAEGVDVLVLGCTHFLCLAREFAAAGAPDLTVFDSRDGVVRRALAVLSERGFRAAPDFGARAGDRLFATGPSSFEPKWERFGALFDIAFSGGLEATR